MVPSSLIMASAHGQCEGTEEVVPVACRCYWREDLRYRMRTSEEPKRPVLPRPLSAIEGTEFRACRPVVLLALSAIAVLFSVPLNSCSSNEYDPVAGLRQRWEASQRRSPAWVLGTLGSPDPMEKYPLWAAQSAIEIPLQAQSRIPSLAATINDPDIAVGPLTAPVMHMVDVQWLSAKIEFRCRKGERDLSFISFEIGPEDTARLTGIEVDVLSLGLAYPVQTRWDDGGIAVYKFYQDDEGHFQPTPLGRRSWLSRLQRHGEVLVEVALRVNRQRERMFHFRWSLNGSSDAISKARENCANS